MIKLIRFSRTISSIKYHSTMRRPGLQNKPVEIKTDLHRSAVAQMQSATEPNHLSVVRVPVPPGNGLDNPGSNKGCLPLPLHLLNSFIEFRFYSNVKSIQK
jgi:hypothetical protein